MRKKYSEQCYICREQEAEMSVVPMMAEQRSDPEDCTGVLLLESLEKKC